MSRPHPHPPARRLVIVYLVIFCLFAGGPVDTRGADILDDSLSPHKQYSVQFQWANRNTAVSLSPEEFYLLESTVPGIEVRLDTAAYEGRRARIYLALARQIEGLISTESFLLSWKTDRQFYPGSVRPGNRTLLFDGVIESPVLVEIFTFTLEVDARYLHGKIQYAPVYEIETE